MRNNKHKNRKALIVRLDKIAEGSAWKDDNLENMVITVEHCVLNPFPKETPEEGDYYAGEILYLPPDATPILLPDIIGVRGHFTVLFSRPFTKQEQQDFDRARMYGKNIL
jgi:hypothetical protein